MGIEVSRLVKGNSTWVDTWTRAHARTIHKCNRVGANQARQLKMVPTMPSPPPSQTRAMTPVTTEAEANTIAN